MGHTYYYTGDSYKMPINKNETIIVTNMYVIEDGYRYDSWRVQYKTDDKIYYVGTSDNTYPLGSDFVQYNSNYIVVLQVDNWGQELSDRYPVGIFDIKSKRGIRGRQHQEEMNEIYRENFKRSNKKKYK